MNKLYYGDNLEIMRDMQSNSIDLIYLDPPFNSKANYNVFYRENGDEKSKAQVTAFEDTWRWGNKAEEEYHEIMKTSSESISEIIKAFRELSRPRDVVVGPSEDGGYWAVGMTQKHSIFDSMSWSHNNVFKDQIQVLKSKNLSYSILDLCFDLDTKKDHDRYLNSVQSGGIGNKF